MRVRHLTNGRFRFRTTLLQLFTLDTEFGTRPSGSGGADGDLVVSVRLSTIRGELEAMSDDQLIEYLKEWKVSEAVHFSPTAEGLGVHWGCRRASTRASFCSPLIG